VIYPTARAVALAALGAPIAILIALIAPGLWMIGAAWVVAALALALADAGLGAARERAALSLAAPASLAAGKSGEAVVEVAFAGDAPPASVEMALEGCERLALSPDRWTIRTRGGGGRGGCTITGRRRGPGRLARVWARWRGPLGLVWKQIGEPVDRAVPVTLDIQGVKDEAMRLFSRDAPAGARFQRDLGGGAEFHALRDFQPGMDRRTIDWKQSARHGALLAKEFHVERNHQLMLVLDTGRLMCEPLRDLPRIDHALNAALLLAYAALKTGDRVGVFGFDAKPSLSSGFLSGPSAFAHIQRLVAGVDYRADETNYTLGLTALSARLTRRSLLVVFTDFADTTSAERMLDNIGRLLSAHLVLFVVMRDDELEAMVREAPRTPEDVSRAAVAAALLSERELVIEKLRRLGVQVVQAPARRIGPALLARYLELKRRDML
jgi:uncharacterized protein (DUF58 family)